MTMSFKSMFFLDVALSIILHVTNTSKELAASVVRVKVVTMDKKVLPNLVTDTTLQLSHPNSLL